MDSFEKYLIESVAFSFEDELESENENSEFDYKKISKAKNILSALGPEHKAFYTDSYILNKYEFANKIKGEMFHMTDQEYLVNDSGDDGIYWSFSSPDDEDSYEITEIKYIQTSLRREFLEFDIRKLNDGSDYVIVYDILKNSYSNIQ